MRRKILFMVWFLTPVLLLAYHYGPGQQGVARDKVVQKLAEAQQAETSEHWKAAMTAYGEALAALPPEETGARFKLRLAQAKARMYSGELPEAMEDMETLLADQLKGKSPPAQVRETRGTLGIAQYYAAWLMRLEGAPADEWMIPVESSRQNFRLLAEETEKAEPKLAADYKKNLESAVRLARMDLSELEGMPLPKFCQGCKNCSQKCRSQRESQCKNPGEKEPEKPKDARKAGVGRRVGSGS